MAGPTDKKRKRTGKQREEAKRAAIAAAAAAEAGESGVQQESKEVEVEKPTESAVEMPVEAAPEENEAQPDSTDAPQNPETGEEVPAEGSKKRKRTGKMREEAKRLAIQKRLEAEAAARERGEEVPQVPESEEKKVDFEKIAQRIPPALKKLHPVFKHAKKAETMRLIKKIRFLKSKDNKDEAAELETQLKFLSVINLNTVASTHLRQKLKKHHTLKHETLPDTIMTLLPVASSVEASSSTSPDLITKVENRLCSSKQVADAIKPVVSWVLSEPGATLSIGAGKQKDGKKGGSRKRTAADSDDDGSVGDVEDGSDDEGLPIGAVTALDSDDEAVIEERAADEAGWESGDLGGEDHGDAAGWESGSVSGGEDEDRYNIAPPSSSGSDSDTPPAKKAKQMKDKLLAKEKPAKAEKARAPPPKADGSSSMFLPSLAAGFAAGDSDSDPDMDYDPTGTIGTKTAPRKNRRGQRARQAIWEKKYGAGAKHVVKAREEAMKKERGPNGERRDSGWGARGARGPAPAPAAAPAAVAPAARAAPAAPARKPAPAQEDKMHPSWLAAKARKEREMAVAKEVKATKIVFD